MMVLWRNRVMLTTIDDSTHKATGMLTTNDDGIWGEAGITADD